MLTSQMMQFADSWITQKSKYFENKSQFFSLLKKFVIHTLRAILWQKIVF